MYVLNHRENQHQWKKHKIGVPVSKELAVTEIREAFSALFAHFAPLLKSFLAAGAGQNSENIEELVQETMVKVWRKAGNYNRSQSNANTWIYTIARNTRIDWIRKQIRQNPNQLHAEDIYDAEATVTPTRL